MFLPVPADRPAQQLQTQVKVTNRQLWKAGLLQMLKMMSWQQRQQRQARKQHHLSFAWTSTGIKDQDWSDSVMCVTPDLA